jgi:hypothetical protein
VAAAVGLISRTFGCSPAGVLDAVDRITDKDNFEDVDQNGHSCSYDSTEAHFAG